MGIRRSYGKNKKSNRPTDAATVERQDILRRVANVRSRFDSTRRGAAVTPDRPAPGAPSSQDEGSASGPARAPVKK
jgi:hypothetical protein